MKYLGISIDSHLNWHSHTTALSTKLSRAIGMLYKIRHFVDYPTLRMIYFGIFHPYLHMAVKFGVKITPSPKSFKFYKIKHYVLFHSNLAVPPHLPYLKTVKYLNWLIMLISKISYLPMTV